ncbi:hypothetical protein [Emticicia sp. 17c]|uniref:hypothetical protein n=1 Tax=Emticicia sp. 17c TaxID=3127704 RepID=UPI00301C72A2
MKNPIICDTNVWYRFADGRLKIEDYSNYNLVPTWINIHEMLTTKDFQNKRALAMFQIMLKCKDFKYLSPIQYFKSEMFRDNYSEEGKNISLLLTNITKDLSNDKFDVHGTMTSKKYRELLWNDENLSEIEINETIETYRNIYRTQLKNLLKSCNGQVQHFESTKEFLSFFLNGGNKFDFWKFDFSDYELLLYTVNQFFITLGKASSGFKFDKNDWEDVLNLTYVKQDMLYWTFEKKWIKYIKDSGMERYLFNVKN